MCNILKTADRRAKWMKIWEFSLGSFGAFAKFPLSRFSKGYWTPSFHPVSIKLYGKHSNRRGGGYRVLLFKSLCTLKLLLTQDHTLYRAGNFKILLLLQFSSNVSPILWGRWLPWGNKGVTFLWNWPSFKNFVAVWNLTWESMGKS